MATVMLAKTGKYSTFHTLYFQKPKLYINSNCKNLMTRLNITDSFYFMDQMDYTHGPWITYVDNILHGVYLYWNNDFVLFLHEL
jgi:hypothetical protein